MQAHLQTRSSVVGNTNQRVIDAGWEAIVREGLPGKVLAGRYRVETRGQRAGVAAWYRVRHLRLGEPARLCLLDHGEAGRWRRALWSEAEWARQVNSIHVLPLSDIGLTEDGRLFFVRPLPQASSLARLIRGSVPPVEEARAVLAQLAEALAAMHTVGLAHHALDPDHIFVARASKRPFVWLSVVGSCSGQVERCASAYAAPEQRPDASLAPTANVYSFAAIARDLLAGPQPTSHRGRARVVLAPSLQRALSYDPARRPCCVTSLAAELIGARPVSPRSVAP